MEPRSYFPAASVDHTDARKHVRNPDKPSRDTDQEIRTSFDLQESHRTEAPSLLSSQPDAQNRLLPCLVPPKSHAGTDLVSPFDRVRRPNAELITSVLGWLT
jgi:hypothetical protein